MRKICPPKFITKLLRSKGIRINDIVRDHYQRPSGTSLADKLKKEGLPAKEAKELERFITDKVDEFLRKDRENILDRLLGKKLPDKRVRQASINDILKAKGDGYYSNTRLIEQVAKGKSLQSFTGEMRQKIYEATKVIDQAKDPRSKAIAMAEIQRIYDELKPGDIGKKARALQISNMLLKFSIGAQNTLGNLLQAGIDGVNNAIAAGIMDIYASPQILLGKKGSELGYLFGKRLPEALQANYNFQTGKLSLGSFYKGFSEAWEEVVKDIDTKNDIRNLENFTLRPFKNKGLTGFLQTAETAGYFITKGLDFLLRPMDRGFRALYEHDSLLQQMRDAEVSIPSPEMIIKARIEGLRGALSEDTVAARAMTGIQRVLPLGKLFMPFTKVPANLMISRVIEYSPLKVFGLMSDVLYRVADDQAKGAKNPLESVYKALSGVIPKAKSERELITEGSKIITGGALYGAGAYLAAQGLYKPNDLGSFTAKQREETALEESLGMQKGALKVGDLHVSIAKLGLAQIDIGARMYQAMKARDFPELNALQTTGLAMQQALYQLVVGSLSETAKGSSRPLGINPDNIARGFEQVQQGQDPSTALAEPLTGQILESVSYQIIPLSALSTEILSLFDTYRETYDPQPLKRAGNKILSRYNLSRSPVRLNVFGEELTEKKAGFGNPLKTTKEKQDFAGQELYRLSQLNPGRTVIQQDRKSIDGRKLTTEEYQSVKRITGKYRRQFFTSLFDTDDYAELDDEYKTEVVRKLDRIFYAAAKEEALGIETKSYKKALRQLKAAEENEDYESFAVRILRKTAYSLRKRDAEEEDNE